MAGTFTLTLLALKELFRSRGFVIGSAVYLGGCMALAFLPGGGGPGLDAVKFYLSLGWFLCYAFGLGVGVFSPVRSFARDQEERLNLLLGTRPVPALSVLLGKFLASLCAGAVALLAGCLVLYAGSAIVAARRGVSLSELRGCRPYDLPLRAVSPLAVDSLARELARDTAFLERYGREGVRRIALRSLSVWRVGAGESITVKWSGLPPGVEGTYLRFTPRIYPPWSDAYVKVTAGGRTIERRLRTSIPERIDLPQGAIEPDGALTVTVAVTQTGDSRALVAFVPPDGIAVYVPETGFLGNLLRGALVAIVVAGALAAFGVLAGSALSYPVAVLAGMTFIIVGLGAGLFTEALREFTGPLQHHHGPGPVQEPIPLPVREAWRFVVSAVLKAFPSLGDFDIGLALGDGRLIPLSAALKNFALNLCARGGAALALAWIIFRKREMGRRT